MQQPVPVADLVHRRPARVVLLERAARHRRAEDVAPVDRVRAPRRPGRDPRGRQRAVAQEDGAGGDPGRAGRRLQRRLEVDVERRVGALAQGDLHGLVVAVGGPGAVDGARDPQVAVADAGVGVGDGDGVELGGDHGVGHVVGGGWD